MGRRRTNNAMGNATADRSRRASTGRASGFTLIELLVTLTVIAVLLAILLLAFNAVRENAKRTITSRLLMNIKQGIETFERDTGYLPPLLVPNSMDYAHFDNEPTTRVETIVPEAQDNAGDALRAARYHSDYSLTAYLIGTGDIDGDAESASQDENVFPNTDMDDGVAGPGIRSPGRDKSWGGARDRADHMASTTGRVLGPYLDPGTLGDALRIDPNTGLYRLYDAFDSPVRYYRYWPTAEIESDGTRTQTLNGVPIELLDFQSVANAVEFDDAVTFEDNRDVLSFEYMLVSAGMEPVDAINVEATGGLGSDSIGTEESSLQLDAFGDVAVNDNDLQTTYLDLASTGMGDDPPQIEPLKNTEDLWKGTRPLLETNVKEGR